ncbi:uncharacterized protein LOC134780092 [Penaeus indicus]|uniref:uncharacterized protein LOC134780092 n=1 Tax=Penaeus indicus TaxID=29960 RepID=UPI00300CD30B
MAKIAQAEETSVGANFTGHVGERDGDAPEVVGKYELGVRNEAGNWIVDSAIAHHLAIVNIFKKRMTRCTTYVSCGLHSQIYYILCRREKMRMFKACNVLPKEAVTKHKLVPGRIGFSEKNNKDSKTEDQKESQDVYQAK